MTTLVRSIDAAAAGYIRQRFVRALGASVIVAFLFGLVLTIIASELTIVRSGDLMQLLLSPLGVLLVIILFVAPTALLIAASSALTDALHRRLTGIVLLGLALVALFYMLGGVATAAFVLAGDRVETRYGPMSVEDALRLGAFGLAGGLIAYEILRHAWWQTSAQAADFRAVRGWRPPPWRLIATFRRHLGLPSFLSHVGRNRLLVSLLYFGVAVLNLGLVMLFSLPVLADESSADYGIDPIAVIVVMGSLLLLNLVGAGALLARVADKRATKLYQSVREWDTRPPIVFLRDFDQDKQRLRATGGDAFARWPAGVGRPRTLDEILLEHGSPYGPVIAIGDPRDPTPPLGAARVFVEGAGNEWQDVVRALAGASRAVVMCPNHGEGVQWELDLIAQAGGRLQTIFLASPELDRQATLALFERLVPSVPEILYRQRPIAAYAHDGAWRVLTAKRLSVESYTAALNTALQALFGLKGVPVPKRSAAQQHGAPVNRLHVTGA